MMRDAAGRKNEQVVRKKCIFHKKCRLRMRDAAGRRDEQVVR